MQIKLDKIQNLKLELVFESEGGHESWHPGSNTPIAQQLVELKQAAYRRGIDVKTFIVSREMEKTKNASCQGDVDDMEFYAPKEKLREVLEQNLPNPRQRGFLHVVIEGDAFKTSGASDRSIITEVKRLWSTAVIQKSWWDRLKNYFSWSIVLNPSTWLTLAAIVFCIGLPVNLISAGASASTVMGLILSTLALSGVSSILMVVAVMYSNCKPPKEGRLVEDYFQSRLAWASSNRAGAIIWGLGVALSLAALVATLVFIIDPNIPGLKEFFDFMISTLTTGHQDFLAMLGISFDVNDIQLGAGGIIGILMVSSGLLLADGITRVMQTIDENRDPAADQQDESKVSVEVKDEVNKNVSPPQDQDVNNFSNFFDEEKSKDDEVVAAKDPSDDNGLKK